MSIAKNKHVLVNIAYVQNAKFQRYVNFNIDTNSVTSNIKVEFSLHD